MYSSTILLCGLFSLAFDSLQQPPPAGKPTTTSATALGRISGTLSYPSEYIPADMKVTAVSLSGGGTYSTTKKSGRRYTLTLPAGEYYVYATTRDLAKYKAYYTEMVTCGLTVDCPSHKKIIVKVKAGATTAKVDPQDWYDN